MIESSKLSIVRHLGVENKLTSITPSSERKVVVMLCDPKEEESVRNKSLKSMYSLKRIACASLSGKRYMRVFASLEDSI